METPSRMLELSPTFLFLVFAVALIYASVGHGGASGYLAVLSLGQLSTVEMASSALVLNVLVAGTALAVYGAARRFSWRLFWPFAIASLPAAFFGGRLAISHRVYEGLLVPVLLVAAWQLWARIEMREGLVAGPPRWTIALPTGVGVGVLSGMVGIGGGIFLSPLLLLLRWARAKETAAVSAAFVLLNSLAGIAGRLAGGQFQPGVAAPLAGAAFVGGLSGALLGAHRLSGMALRRVLAIVLLVAVAKIVVRMAT